MFYSEAILLRRGRFALIWIAAHYLKKISRRELLSVNVPRTCEDLINYICCRVAAPHHGYSRPRWSLYLSSKLMSGVIRVHQKQTQYLWIDLTTMMNDFKASLVKIYQSIDLPPLPITMAREEIIDDPTVDFGQWKYLTPERQKYDFRADSSAFEWPPIDRAGERSPSYFHQSPPELITLAEQQILEQEFVVDDLPPLDNDILMELSRIDEVELPSELAVDKLPEFPTISPSKVVDEVPDRGISPGQSLASSSTPPKRDEIEFSSLDLASEIEPPPKKPRKPRLLVIDTNTRLPDNEIRQNLLDPYAHCQVRNKGARRGHLREQFRNLHARVPFKTMLRSTGKWDFVPARQPSGGLEGFFRERPIAPKLRKLLTSHCKFPQWVPIEEIVQFTDSIDEGSIFDEEEPSPPPRAVGEKTLFGEEPPEEPRDPTSASQLGLLGVDSLDPSLLRDSTSEIGTPQIEAVLQEPIFQQESLARVEEESPERQQAVPALPKTPQRRTRASPKPKKTPQRRARASPSPSMNGGPPSDSTVYDFSPRRSPRSPAQRVRRPRFPPLSTPPYFPSPTPPRDPRLTSQAVNDLIVSEQNELGDEVILTFRRLCPADRYVKREAAAMFSTVLSLHKQIRVYLEQFPPHTFQTIVYSDIFIDSSDRFD